MPFCPHCNRNTFEILAVDVGGTKYNCVQCSGCKAPVSFVESSRVEESDEAFETRVTEVLRVVVSSFANNQFSAHSYGADNANEAVMPNRLQQHATLQPSSDTTHRGTRSDLGLALSEAQSACQAPLPAPLRRAYTPAIAASLVRWDRRSSQN
jgi:hypothetical protein